MSVCLSVCPCVRLSVRVSVCSLARGVLQTPLSFIHSLIQLVGNPFVQVSSKHQPIPKTYEVDTWNFLMNIHLPPQIRCLVSGVTIHESQVFFFADVVKLVGGGPVF